MKTFIFSLATLIFLTALRAPMSSASVTLPDDGPYYRVRRDRTLYVYDSATRDSIEQIAAYMRTIRLAYDQSFGWKLDEEQDLLLLSPRQQIANAYATFSPNVKSVWYPSGSSFLEDMAESSWALALTTHETSHLYQLNAKGPVPAAISRVVGNSLIFLPVFPPIFIHPNALTPTFLIEGNAVLNESRANLGGRLHSGEARALVLAQIQAGDIDPNRLINNEFRFPYGDNPYLQGGYFQAHLATKYGVDKTNQFFLAQGNHYLVPLILNKTFREHFGASYPQEIREYVREMEALASQQKSTASQVLSAAPFIGAFNHDSNQIFYLASDGIALPRLETYDKSSHQLSSKPRDLPVGKVFWVDGEPESSATLLHDLHHQEYSLYGEGESFDSKYRGQIVNDIRAGKVAAMDATNSWLDPHILVNSEPYDVGVTQPILDEQGNVFYFRQNGSERVLYRNREPLFKLDGFFAKASEVDEDGGFYFIANTDYGSSLYRFQNHEVSRLLKSDRVVDARRVNDHEFLVNEVTAWGHEIKLAQVDSKPATPAVYSYGFPSYNLLPGSLSSAEQTQKDERSYSSFREMRYSNMDVISSYDQGNGFGLTVDTHFNDPLEFQNLELAYSGSEFGTQNTYLRYSFTKFLPEFFVAYLYQRDREFRFFTPDRWNYSQWVGLGARLPVWRWQHWDAAVTVTATYKQDHYDTYGSDTSAELHYNQSPELGMYSLKAFDLSYMNHLQSIPELHWKKSEDSSLVQLQYQQGFGGQVYATVTGKTAWSQGHDINVDYGPQSFSDEIRIDRIAPHEYYIVQSANVARLELAKVYDIRSYSSRSPIGLDRVAPIIVGQGLFLDNKGRDYGDYPANIFEWGVGADFQLLLFHLGHAKMRYLMGYDTRHPVTSSSSWQLSFHHDF